VRATIWLKGRVDPTVALHGVDQGAPRRCAKLLDLAVAKDERMILCSSWIASRLDASVE